MTANDIKVLKGAGSRRLFRVCNRNASGASYTQKPGEVVQDSQTYAHLVEDGQPVIGTSVVLGVVVTESTETALAAGDVTLTTIIPNVTVLRGKATTTTNCDTIAELRTILSKQKMFDLTASTGTNGVYTIDENDGHDANANGLIIIDGDPVDGTLDVVVHGGATQAVILIGQTMD